MKFIYSVAHGLGINAARAEICPLRPTNLDAGCLTRSALAFASKPMVIQLPVGVAK